MKKASNASSQTRAPGQPAPRPKLSKGARRDIRRASALANELNMHSFRTHVDGSITWTLKHAKTAQPKARAADSVATERKLRSRDLAIAHRELQQRVQTIVELMSSREKNQDSRSAEDSRFKIPWSKDLKNRSLSPSGSL